MSERDLATLLEEVGSTALAGLSEENRFGRERYTERYVPLMRQRVKAIRERAQYAKAEAWLRAHDGWIGASG